MMTLMDCYLPVFKQVLLMTGTPEEFENYEQSRHTCLFLLEQAFHKTEHLEISEDEKESARVAVISWLDETVLCSALQWRPRWQSELLQRKYLNITVAGEYFFTRLEQLDPTQEQARDVFLFCLQQGFHGKYSAPDDQPILQALIAEQRSQCLPGQWQTWPNDAAITPDLFMPTDTITQRLRPLLLMTAGVVLLYVSLYFFFQYYVS